MHQCKYYTHVDLQETSNFTLQFRIDKHKVMCKNKHCVGEAETKKIT